MNAIRNGASPVSAGLLLAALALFAANIAGISLTLRGSLHLDPTVGTLLVWATWFGSAACASWAFARIPAIARMRLGRWLLVALVYIGVFVVEFVVTSQTWMSLGGRVT